MNKSKKIIRHNEIKKVTHYKDSPCIGVCSTLFDDVCRGCGRTAQEVSDWVLMSSKEKERVWVRILKQGYPV